MPASIHPPVQLHIVLDENSYQGGDSVEMARRFTAVAPTDVVRASKGSQRANVLRFDLGDDVVTAEADDDPLWRDALTTWLDEEFAETSALVARENDARQNNGEQPVPFAWAEVKFGAGPVIAIRMKDSAIPPEAAGFVARARQLLVGGAFGADDIAAIRIPACASIEAQRADAHRAEYLEAQQYEAEHRPVLQEVDRYSEEVDLATGEGWTDELQGSQSKRDAPTDSELAEAVAEAEAALRRGDDPADVAAEEAAVDVEESAPPASVVTDEPAQGKSSMSDGRGREDFGVDTSGESCAREGGEVPSTLDYRIWNVAYADGTSVRFDSVLGEAILD